MLGSGGEEAGGGGCLEAPGNLGGGVLGAPGSFENKIIAQACKLMGHRVGESPFPSPSLAKGNTLVNMVSVRNTRFQIQRI